MLDGLYVFLDGAHGQAFLFERDGIVLDALLRRARDEEWGDLREIHGWLRRGTRGVVEGRYTSNAKHVRIETIGHFGDGERLTIWEGSVVGDRLVLGFFDHHSSRRGRGHLFERIAKPRRTDR